MDEYLIDMVHLAADVANPPSPHSPPAVTSVGLGAMPAEADVVCRVFSNVYSNNMVPHATVATPRALLIITT